MHVYTPPGYELGRGRYPVFYLLHGAGDSDEAWSSVGRAGFILDNLIAAGKSVEHYETVRQRKDGTLVSVSVTVSPVRDETGRVVGASAVARDITDRRRANEAVAYLASIVESSAEVNEQRYEVPPPPKRFFIVQ